MCSEESLASFQQSKIRLPARKLESFLIGMCYDWMGLGKQAFLDAGMLLKYLNRLWFAGMHVKRSLKLLGVLYLGRVLPILGSASSVALASTPTLVISSSLPLVLGIAIL